MKHWTDGGLEMAGEIDNIKPWTDGGGLKWLERLTT